MQQAQMLQGRSQAGLDLFAKIPWGTHICGFYKKKSDLANIAVRYFKTGLERNEYCLWVVAEPISVDEAERILEESIDCFDTYRRKGQIEILSSEDWYIKGGNFKSESVLKAWLDRLNWALGVGYKGARVSGNMTWVEKEYFKTLMDYEAEIEKKIGNYKLTALCTYQLEPYGIHQIMEIINNHQLSFFNGEYRFDGLNRYASMNLVGKMAASIAHEIRNPMTTVRGFLQLLQSNEELQNYNSYFSLMIDELDQADATISDFVSLARGEKPVVVEKNY